MPKNLLGAEQHGQIAGVGFDLYCRLLEKTINTLQNGGNPDEPVAPDPVIEMKLDAYIPRWVHRQSPGTSWNCTIASEI